MFYILVVFFFLIDRLSKLIMANLLAKGSINFIPNFFSLTLVQNTGAAFGTFQGNKHVLILLSLIIMMMIFMVYLYEKKSITLLGHIFFALLLGGALGNLFDRFTLGYVIDFINFHFWPTFNFADIFINIGVFGLLVYYLFIKPKEKLS